jgi:hypothetical protein
MKLVKSAAIAFAMSAMLAGPVFAQGVSSDTQIRGGARGGGAQGMGSMQGGTSGIGDVDLNAQTGASGAGINATTGARGTVGTGSGGAPQGVGGVVGAPATGARR